MLQFSIGKYEQSRGPFNPSYYKKPISPYYVEPLENQHGKGVVEVAGQILTAKEIIENLAKITSKAYNLYGSQTISDARNLYGNYINPNPNSKPGFVNEKPLLDPVTGSFYNWVVKDRNTEERIKRDDTALDELDQCAKDQALSYKGAKNKNDIRRADNIFLSCAKNSNVNPISKGLVTGISKIKTISEDLNVNSFDKFGYMPNLQKGAGMTDIKKPSISSSTKIGGKHYAPDLTRKVRQKKPNPIKKLEAKFKKFQIK